MNLTRIVIFCVALSAAAAAVFVVRGIIGGGTPTVQASVPPPATTVDILVASKEIQPGRALDVQSVRWDSWPKSAMADGFILKETQPDLAKAVDGVVVRAPLVAGQPITDAFIVRAGAAGFLAATIAPGMRGVSLPVSAETSAGGFILPNDRVDIILTREVGQRGQVKIFNTVTILRDVRVLAIDQTAQQPKDSQAAVGKTATIELTPKQTELVASARAVGTVALTLRPLGDSEDDTALTGEPFGPGNGNGGVNVIRYGVARNNAQGNNPEERTPQ